MVVDDETIKASLVFINISGFASISENETPDSVVKLLTSNFDVIFLKLFHTTVLSIILLPMQYVKIH